MHDDDVEIGPVGRPDPEVEAALRAHFGDLPRDVDWVALDARIVAAARFRLAARAGQAGWRAPASRWARTAVPVGLAASAILLLGLAFGPAPADSAPLALEDVVAVAASDGLPADPLAVTDQEMFLSTVLESGE